MIHTKREELIAFIRKQMEGPGGCNGNYTLASDNWNEEEEVVNTTPGSIYSTGVLFPNKKVVDGGNIASENNDAVFEAPSTSDDIEDDTTPSDRNEANGAIGSDVDDEDIYSLNRRFPNTIGISFCLDHDADLTRDVAITISGRYYTKL